MLPRGELLQYALTVLHLLWQFAPLPLLVDGKSQVKHHISSRLNVSTINCALLTGARPLFSPGRSILGRFTFRVDSRLFGMSNWAEET